jgi:hypothetical protein
MLQIVGHLDRDDMVAVLNRAHAIEKAVFAEGLSDMEAEGNA